MVRGWWLIEFPAVKYQLVLATLLIPAIAFSQGAAGVAPRMTPVPEGQRTDEQRMIASEFAPNGMSNAVGTLLVYPGLARRIFAHDRYLTSESTLLPRHRSLLGLRAAWLARSNYLWAHRAPAARKAGLTDADLPQTWDDLARVAEALTRKLIEPVSMTMYGASSQTP